MTTLLEDPRPLLYFGILAEAVLAIVLLRTGRGVLLWVMLGLAVLVAAGVWVEWLVVTEVERVEAVLESAMRAVAADDQQAVMEHFHSSATQPRGLVRWAFSYVHFTGAKITGMKTSIDEKADPPRATVELSGTVWFEARRGDIPYSVYPSSGTIILHRYPEGWLITGYDLNKDPR